MTTITIHGDLDLVFSQDDQDNNGAGWYFDDHDEDKVSISYESKEQALAALKSDGIEWESCDQQADRNERMTALKQIRAGLTSEHNHETAKAFEYAIRRIGLQTVNPDRDLCNMEVNESVCAAELEHGGSVDGQTVACAIGDFYDIGNEWIV